MYAFFNIDDQPDTISELEKIKHTIGTPFMDEGRIWLHMKIPYSFREGEVDSWFELWKISPQNEVPSIWNSFP
jgi:hypothetical protein